MKASNADLPREVQVGQVVDRDQVERRGDEHAEQPRHAPLHRLGAACWPFQAYMADCTIRNTARPQANDSTMNIGASRADW